MAPGESDDIYADGRIVLTDAVMLTRNQSNKKIAYFTLEQLIKFIGDNSEVVSGKLSFKPKQE